MSTSWRVYQLDSYDTGTSVTTYELGTIYMPIPLDKVVDIPILHPLRNHRKPVLIQCHAKQWQDVGMPEVFPGNSLSTESLRFTRLSGMMVQVSHSRYG